jgi:hypothetical protein
MPARRSALPLATLGKLKPNAWGKFRFRTVSARAHAASFNVDLV